MHRLLRRQIKKHVPEGDIDRLEKFFEAVNQSYLDFEDDNQQLERTLERSSQELIKANIELRTSLENTTEEAKDIADRLKDVVNNVAEVIFQMDNQGNWTFLNPAWEFITGFAIKDSLGKNKLWFIHKEDKAICKNIFKGLKDGAENNCSAVLRVNKKDGEVIYTEVFIRAIRGVENLFLGASGTLRDITEQRKSQNALIKAKEEAERASQAKAQFLSTMSHEIRTPMNAVIGLTQLLIEDNPRDDQIQNLKALSFSSTSLLGLINDILDFSKIESGKIELENIDFSMNDLMTGIRHSMNFKAQEQGIQFNINMAEELDYLVGDQTRLSQILNNLVSNAIKFTNEGEVNLNIEIKEQVEDTILISFSVVDTGIGIPEEKRDTVFQSFSQAASDITRKYGGTGLGLAITKKLLELMGSEIQLESEVGKGSVFSFDLSFGVSEKSDQTAAADGGEDSVGSLTGLKKLHVLLVEDNPMNVLVAQQFLHKWELSMDHAENGLVAVEKVQEANYDIILMDLQMPELDGYSATGRIRQLEGDYFKNIPIIALTADAMVEIRSKVIAAGMNDYVAKPFDQEDLYRKIRKHTT